jgi:pimeloyl-ACP methyl ester carboxylesterase
MKLMKLAGAAATVALAVGLGVTLTPSAQATTLTAATHPSALTWGACPPAAEGDTSRDPRQQCATLRVPLDYRNPQRHTIEVEVSRIPAAKPDERLGVLLMNGGGPGPSLDVPSVFGSYLPKSVSDRYDMVAFDPRGISHSTPMTCGRTTEELTRDETLTVLSFPGADGSIDRNVDYSRRLAADCAAHSGDLLPYLTTANIARDMDRLRQALGEKTVSYYGISWGTYLGSVYRALFPRTIDRMVLDSSVDPTKRGYDDFRTFSGAVEDRWPDLAHYAAANAGTVGYGSTERRVRERYLSVTATLDRHPVTLAGSPAKLDGNLVRLFTFLLSYNDASLPQLGALWHAAGDFAAGTPTADDTALVESVANGFAAQGALPGIPADNLYTVGYAINCAEATWPHDLRQYQRNVTADRAAYPITAGAPANVAPCTFWPVQPLESRVDVRELGNRNVLMLQNFRDPATPLRSAQSLHRALGRDSVLVDVDAGGHGVLIHPQPSTCAVGALETYFTTGQLPAGDKHCGKA